MNAAPAGHSRGRQRSPRKADAILKGARQEFLQRGYAAASMDRIAATAGVSKPTIYSHYGDKASLFRALTCWMVQRRVEDVFGPSSPAPPGPKQARRQLAQLAARIVEVNERQPEMLDFLRLVIGESGRFPDLAKGFVAEVQQRALTRLTQILAVITDQPELRARIFIGALMQTILFEDVLHGGDLTPSCKSSIAKLVVELVTSQPDHT
ncbi:bacterial regulatory s/ tetR family protein [Synechococcus sp. RS9909]|uniref:TetR/AcrR family transcriptional regulator n=1 Tax=unclassified Synechococcus TaxID=2626047 RepID=UPI000068F8F2|nr:MULTISPECIES: TetR/AcrR family transcriptional regulator [unclassified Synechococcus]EAQ69363.1 transcriptional regulator [Synechococcus sp. RS9917]QNI79384.1 bacterial regulatory s/ tetR family protein [Synechococcus sp. RS9909]